MSTVHDSTYIYDLERTLVPSGTIRRRLTTNSTRLLAQALPRGASKVVLFTCNTNRGLRSERSRTATGPQVLRIIQYRTIRRNSLPFRIRTAYAYLSVGTNPQSNDTVLASPFSVKYRDS